MCFTAMLEQWIKTVPSPTWDKVGDSMNKIIALKVDNYKQTSKCNNSSIATTFLYVCVCMCLCVCVCCALYRKLYKLKHF